MNERGRPSKLNAALILEIKGHIEAGMLFDTACGLVGISDDTGKRWMREGQRLIDEQPDKTMDEWIDEGVLYPPFTQSCNVALRKAEGLILV